MMIVWCHFPISYIMDTIISIMTNTHLTTILFHQLATSFASTIAYSAVQVHCDTNKANMDTINLCPYMMNV